MWRVMVAKLHSPAMYPFMSWERARMGKHGVSHMPSGMSMLINQGVSHGLVSRS